MAGGRMGASGRRAKPADAPVLPGRAGPGSGLNPGEESAVEVTRTPDRRFRKPLLYPAELPLRAY